MQFLKTIVANLDRVNGSFRQWWWNYKSSAVRVREERAQTARRYTRVELLFEKIHKNKNLSKLLSKQWPNMQDIRKVRGQFKQNYHKICNV
jgi:hypothetical protein